MVSLSTVLAAVVEDMENSGIDYGDVENAVCNLKHDVREKNKEFSTIDELRDIRVLLDNAAAYVV